MIYHNYTKKYKIYNIIYKNTIIYNNILIIRQVSFLKIAHIIRPISFLKIHTYSCLHLNPSVSQSVGIVGDLFLNRCPILSNVLFVYNLSSSIEAMWSFTSDRDLLA